MSIKGVKGCSVEAGRHGPAGEHHFAEAGAAEKQLQGHLGVGQFPEGFQESDGLPRPKPGLARSIHTHPTTLHGPKGL